MSLVSLAAVIAVSSLSHGPGKTADVWNSSRSLRMLGSNLSLFGARAASTHEPLTLGGKASNDVLHPHEAQKSERQQIRQIANSRRKLHSRDSFFL